MLPAAPLTLPSPPPFPAPPPPLLQTQNTTAFLFHSKPPNKRANLTDWGQGLIWTQRAFFPSAQLQELRKSETEASVSRYEANRAANGNEAKPVSVQSLLPQLQSDECAQRISHHLKQQGECVSAVSLIAIILIGYYHRQCEDLSLNPAPRKSVSIEHVWNLHAVGNGRGPQEINKSELNERTMGVLIALFRNISREGCSCYVCPVFHLLMLRDSPLWVR